MKEIQHLADPLENPFSGENLNIFSKKNSLKSNEKETDMFSMLSGRTVNINAINGDLKQTLSVNTNRQTR